MINISLLEYILTSKDYESRDYESQRHWLLISALDSFQKLVK